MAPLRLVRDGRVAGIGSSPVSWVVVAVFGTIWFGRRFEPDPLAGRDLEAVAVDTVPVPDGLPALVARFYEVLYGDQMPVIDSP